MSQWEKPDWSLCKEFQETFTKKTIKHSPRIKTLTRATKKDTEQVKIKIKQQLPVLTPIGIRRYRLPHHECVLLELKELGMPSVAEYMEMLFQNDTNSDIGGSLKFHRNLVDKLKNSLIEAEQARKEYQHLEETTILFNTAVFFQSISHRWFWIVHELLQRALSSAVMIRNDDGLMLNTMKFFYGHFLLRHMKDFEQALALLSEVHDASAGRYWNATEILKTKQDDLYRECNILLCEIYNIKARQLRAIEPKIAVKMSFEALKYANDTGNEKYIAEALYELGKSLMAAEDMASAMKIFAKFLAKVKRMLDYRSICNAHKQLAIARQKLNDDDGIRKHLQSFRECAREHELPDKLAEAHYLTGEYLLEHGLPNDSSPHLKKAFDMYKSLGMLEEIDKSRYLLAISKGEEVLEDYMKLVLNCGSKDKNETLRLLEWKNNRVPFWSSNPKRESLNGNNNSNNNSTIVSNYNTFYFPSRK